ncbi:hypothetical protein HanIR_Chr09g0425141 [Helianthus annuus]|nr:hypothetical protein HanIR_Chr09g0425141 [Helianthus annuus]
MYVCIHAYRYTYTWMLCVYVCVSIYFYTSKEVVKVLEIRCPCSNYIKRQERLLSMIYIMSF